MKIQHMQKLILRHEHSLDAIQDKLKKHQRAKKTQEDDDFDTRRFE